MINKKKFKVSESLKPYVSVVLWREGTPHRFKQEDGEWYCLVSASGEKFHRVVKRAQCEKLTEETGLLHLTYEESQNVCISNALMKTFGRTAFVILGSEENTRRENLFQTKA